MQSELESLNTLSNAYSQLNSTSSFQMNSLIINQKPLLPSRLIASNLSKAATQILFPIRDQKILFMYPQDRKFAQARVQINMND